MAISLYDHQRLAVEQLDSGRILCGGVGSGKSRTAIAYYFTRENGGKINGKSVQMNKPPCDLYIITTARKRDTHEWEGELIPFLLSPDPELNNYSNKVVIDSWNNIKKYADVKDAFFIFDEQRVVGSGAWVKAFLKIAKVNRWILLSATPGDTWMDYIPVFIANGFYKNKTEFIRRHVIFSRFAKYPKVDRYVETGRLIKFKKQITVNMEYTKPTVSHDEWVTVGYDKKLYSVAMKDRWNPYEGEPVRDAGQLCYLLRKIVNSDPSRIEMTKKLIARNPKAIIFYNFDYELEILRKIGEDMNMATAEWNGHKHQPIPDTDEWIYLVQYTAGAEGWNCISTNAIIFYSQNYSYKSTVQAAGRIDRMNTPFTDLYYYHLKSRSSIDLAIHRALIKKSAFNERVFVANSKNR